MTRQLFILTVLLTLAVLCRGQVDTMIYKPASTNIADCNPCWLKMYDQKGQLLYEGDFLTDCCIGTYIERYPNGTLKVKGQYKIPPKEILGEDIFNLGYCRRNGEWIYFKINGDIEKKEIYKDGEIVE